MSLSRWQQDDYNTKCSPLHSVHSCCPNPQTHVAMVPPLFACLLGLPAEENVDLLLYPVFVVGLVCLSISTVNKTAEVCQVINEVKQLADIICNGWTVGIHSLQMLFIHFTDSFHAFIHRFIISICSAFWPLGGLDK